MLRVTFHGRIDTWPVRYSPRRARPFRYSPRHARPFGSCRDRARLFHFAASRAALSKSCRREAAEIDFDASSSPPPRIEFISIYDEPAFVTEIRVILRHCQESGMVTSPLCRVAPRIRDRNPAQTRSCIQSHSSVRLCACSKPCLLSLNSLLKQHQRLIIKRLIERKDEIACRRIDRGQELLRHQAHGLRPIDHKKGTIAR